MRYINRVRVAAGTLVMAGSVAFAHAQMLGIDAEPTAAASSSADKSALKAVNRKLQKTVMRNLSKTRGLDASNILVVARGGVVTLAGSVPKAEQIELAVSAARAVSSVSEVRNDLTIRPEGM
ncbi:BON domain-containing protein [Burkholderia pseudomultivorans]|uniref:BON domain-containing protein n=1 Tax=Burkholderia pseudomultivorans TaxID=1207504 RepID=UPI0007554019|nr:BON domain-containing protein [Burkholderia pseudomultivorans]KVG65411.1 transport-associated protein [Burkholderia pseudomultivorans]